HTDIGLILLFAVGGSFFGISEVRWWFLATFGRKAVRYFAFNSLVAVGLLIVAIRTLGPVYGLWGAALALMLSAGYTFFASLVCQERVV
ncbi:MAG: hypothetical protein AABZ44_02165, partial [Elusimicrobiota bacterium]